MTQTDAHVDPVRVALTPNQTALLIELGKGRELCHSEDGEIAWLDTARNGDRWFNIDWKDMAALRNAGYLRSADDHRFHVEIINDAGNREIARAMQAATAGGVKVKPLVWSEHRPPGEKCHYDHITAPSALGEFSVEWKSWKDYPCYCVYVDGELIGTGDDLSDAKEIGSAYLDRAILGTLEPATPQEGADKPCVIPFGYSCEVCGGDELNCLHDKKAPTPAPEPGSFDSLADLKERLASNITQYQRGILSLDDIEKDETEAADAITTLQQRIAELEREASDYADERTRDLSLALDRATAAEAECAKLREALAPFAEAAREFTFAIGPDGIDDGITLIVKPAVNVAYEATLSTAHFSTARTALAAKSAGGGDVG